LQSVENVWECDNSEGSGAKQAEWRWSKEYCGSAWQVRILCVAQLQYDTIQEFNVDLKAEYTA